MSELQRKSSNKVFAGVCAGIADRLNADVTLVRVIPIILALFFPWAMGLAYVALWIILPDEAGKTGLQQLQKQFGQDNNGPADTFRSDGGF